MALKLYKEINATGFSTGGFLNFIRWLTGESRGSLVGGATTGPVGITVVEVYDGDGAVAREVPNYSGVLAVVDNTQVVAGDTVTIEDPDAVSSQVYTATAGAPAAGEFQVGATAAITATNLAAAITATSVGTSEAISVGDVVSFNTNDSVGSQWNLTTSKPAAITVSGATTASGKLDGLSSNNEWRTSATDINDGWIIIDVPGTGLNGNTGFQFCYQFTGAAGTATAGFALIPNRDWVVGGAAALWTNKTNFMAAGGITVATTPTNVTGGWSATDTWFAWCDEGVVCFSRDEKPVASLQLWYVGEVDGGDPADTKPFVISSLGAMTPILLETDNNFRRVSPIAPFTTELVLSENWGFDHFDSGTAWSTGQTQFTDYGPGWPRSDQWVAFDDAAHSHFAGKLRYVQRTMHDAAIRGTSDTLTRWLTNVAATNALCVSLPWDGATAYF